MSFDDNLRQASFRGFDFALASDSKAFGRNIKKHKIINAGVVHEDVGEKEEPFIVEAVIGGHDGFIGDADEFEALLSQKGMGRLVLPHTKSLDVVVMDARRRHNSNEVGIVYFTITFEVSKDIVQTQSSLSTSSGLLKAASAGHVTGLSDFVSNYQDSVPDFVSDDTLGRLGNFTSGLGSSLNRIQQSLTVPLFTVSGALKFGSEIVTMFRDITSIFNPALDFSVAIDAGEVKDTPSAISVVRALSKASALTITDDEEVSTTTTQSLRASNAAATSLLLKVSSISTAAEAAVYADYSSKKEALEVRDDLLKSMNTIRTNAGVNGWNKSYGALGDLMAAVNRDIDTKLGRLPDTITIDSVSVRSSIALAHRIYASTANIFELSDDITQRNKIINPVFVAAAPLEVLIDA